MNKTMKRVAIIFLALLLVAASIGAYFTGTDAKSDSYTIGQIEVEIVGDDNLYAAEKLTPLYEYDFTRSVQNTGINDAYVFLAVTVPYDKVYTHDASGNQIEADASALQNVQLFTYGTDGVAGVSSKWAPVTAGKFGDYDIATVDGSIKNNSGEYGAVRINNTVTYIYAYVGDNGTTLARLAPDAITDSIFDTMKFANVADTVDQYNIEETAGQIKTQVYAIQCDNVLETTYMEGRNDDGSEAINAVWAVLNTATNDKALSAKDADEVATKTVKLTIVDQDGVVAEGAVVRLTAIDGSGKYVEGTTDASGAVSFEVGNAFPEGTYDVSVQLVCIDGNLREPLNADELGQIVVEGSLEQTISVEMPPVILLSITNKDRRILEVVSVTINDGEERTIVLPGIAPMDENPVEIWLNDTTFSVVSFATAQGTFYLNPPTETDVAYSIGDMSDGCAYANGEFIVGNAYYGIRLVAEPPVVVGPQV